MPCLGFAKFDFSLRCEDGNGLDVPVTIEVEADPAVVAEPAINVVAAGKLEAATAEIRRAKLIDDTRFGFLKQRFLKQSFLKQGFLKQG